MCGLLLGHQGIFASADETPHSTGRNPALNRPEPALNRPEPRTQQAETPHSTGRNPALNERGWVTRSGGG
jgi:hypothetical protein